MGALRLVLATAVVLTHTGGVFGYRILPANVAVEAFFILSGFLMALVLDRKYDARRGKALFYGNRALRIFPAYLTILAGTLVIYALLVPFGGGYYAMLSAQLQVMAPWQAVALLISSLLIVGQDGFLFVANGPGGWAWSATGLDPQVWALNPLPPAWSISLELMFYLLAPFLVRLSTGWLVVLVGVSLGARLVAYAAGYGFDPWSYRFFPFELAWFLVGLLAYRHRSMLGRLPVLANHAVVIVLGATMLGHPAQAALTRLGLGDTLMPLVYLAIIGLALPALFESTAGSARDAALGALSYPLYLVHWPVMTALVTLWPVSGTLAVTARSLLCLALSLAMAQALVVWLERPLTAWRHHRQGT